MPENRPAQIDPRGPRFGAWITSGILAVVLLLSGSATAAGLLLAAQAIVFAFGSRGHSPYGMLFRTLIRPRLAPPTELEDAAPPRFAQLVGLGFAVVGTFGFLAGSTLIGQIFTGFALVAALLNASVGLCLGCEVYLLYRRTVSRTSPIHPTKGATA